MPETKQRTFKPGDFVYVIMYRGDDEKIRENSKLAGIVVRNRFSPGGLQGKLHVACPRLNEYAFNEEGQAEELHLIEDPEEIIHIVPENWVVDRPYPERFELEH